MAFRGPVPHNAGLGQGQCLLEPMFYIPEEDFAELGGFENRLFVVADACQADMPIVYASPEFFAMTGYGVNDVIGHNCRFLQGPETSQDTRKALRAALEQSRMITADILNYRKDGSRFWNRLRMKPIQNEDGVVMYVLGIQNVIDEGAIRPDPIFDRIID